MHDRKSCGCEQRILSSLTEKKEQGTSVSQGIPTVDNGIKLEGSDKSGRKNSDTVITRPSESEPHPVVTRSIKPPNRLSF